MSHFDDIPISKIKTMVGYQTHADMYRSGAKLPPTEDENQKDAYNALKDS
jgi:hypothetical protein